MLGPATWRHKQDVAELRLYSRLFQQRAHARIDGSAYAAYAGSPSTAWYAFRTSSREMIPSSLLKFARLTTGTNGH